VPWTYVSSCFLFLPNTYPPHPGYLPRWPVYHLGLPLGAQAMCGTNRLTKTNKKYKNKEQKQ
jgi:hypothetical protein